jgi:hypothetical protein
MVLKVAGVVKNRERTYFLKGALLVYTNPPISTLSTSSLIA